MTHTSTTPEPITNPEIQAAADRIAHSLVEYALSEIRDLLGDGIGETIADDQDFDRLDSQARGIVYGLVWDRLAQAGADYQRRDQVLTEAAEIAGKVIGPLWHLDTLHEICSQILAARTTTAQEG